MKTNFPLSFNIIFVKYIWKHLSAKPQTWSCQTTPSMGKEQTCFLSSGGGVQIQILSEDIHRKEYVGENDVLVCLAPLIMAQGSNQSLDYVTRPGSEGRSWSWSSLSRCISHSASEQKVRRLSEEFPVEQKWWESVRKWLLLWRSSLGAFGASTARVFPYWAVGYFNLAQTCVWKSQRFLLFYLSEASSGTEDPVSQLQLSGLVWGFFVSRTAPHLHSTDANTNLK